MRLKVGYSSVFPTKGNPKTTFLPLFPIIKMGRVNVFVKDYLDYFESIAHGVFFMFIGFEISITH